jgi:integrase
VARKWWDWWAPGKPERHTGYVLHRLEADVFPSFGHKSINVVTAADIPSLMRTNGTFVVRTSERIESQWSEFDLDGARWDLPAERRKMHTPHIVPLSQQSIAVLLALSLLTGNGRLVFPGANDKQKPMPNNTILFALYRLGYKGRMTGHGFRGLASTIWHENGFQDEHVELQLAHQKRNKVAAA